MTATSTSSSQSCRGLRRFVRDRDAISAVEFALILPFMLTLYLGGTELGNGMAIQFKATLAARTVADLSSQYTSIDSQTMSEILGAASTVVTPYAESNMVVTVSELEFTSGSSSATVQWSCSLNGTARAQNSTFPLPTALQSLPSGTYYLILGEVTYPYSPSIGYTLTGTIDIYEDTLFFPRMSNSVTDNNAC
jgi:Flp pilus assembly protein TadG